MQNPSLYDVEKKYPPKNSIPIKKPIINPLLIKKPSNNLSSSKKKLNKKLAVSKNSASSDISKGLNTANMISKLNKINLLNGKNSTNATETPNTKNEAVIANATNDTKSKNKNKNKNKNRNKNKSRNTNVNANNNSNNNNNNTNNSNNNNTNNSNNNNNTNNSNNNNNNTNNNHNNNNNISININNNNKSNSNNNNNNNNSNITSNYSPRANALSMIKPPSTKLNFFSPLNTLNAYKNTSNTSNAQTPTQNSILKRKINHTPTQITKNTKLKSDDLTQTQTNIHQVLKNNDSTTEKKLHKSGPFTSSGSNLTAKLNSLNNINNSKNNNKKFSLINTIVSQREFPLISVSTSHLQAKEFPLRLIYTEKYGKPKSATWEVVTEDHNSLQFVKRKSSEIRKVFYDENDKIIAFCLNEPTSKAPCNYIVGEKCEELCNHYIVYKLNQSQNQFLKTLQFISSKCDVLSFTLSNTLYNILPFQEEKHLFMATRSVNYDSLIPSVKFEYQSKTPPQLTQATSSSNNNLDFNNHPNNNNTSLDYNKNNNLIINDNDKDNNDNNITINENNKNSSSNNETKIDYELPFSQLRKQLNSNQIDGSKLTSSNPELLSIDESDKTSVNNDEDLKPKPRPTRRSCRQLEYTARYSENEVDAISINTRSRKPPMEPFGSPLKYKFLNTNKTITISDMDVSRLNHGEFLNDVIIDFYLRYLYQNLQNTNPKMAEQTYIFNSFFFTRLTQKSFDKPIRQHENVKRWTSKIDLFSKKYVIIPINEKAHWFVAIIVNADKIITNDKSIDTKSTTEHLDSEYESSFTQTSDINDKNSNLAKENESKYFSKPILTNTETEIELDINSNQQNDSNTKRQPSSCVKEVISISPSSNKINLNNILSESESDENNEDVQVDNNLSEQNKINELDEKEKKRKKRSELYISENQPLSNLKPQRISNRARQSPKKYCSSVEGSHSNNKHIKVNKNKESNNLKIDEISEDSPMIVILDSLSGSHTTISRTLRDYLEGEAMDKKHTLIDRNRIRGKFPPVPKQKNYCDCGIYLLHYIEVLFNNPDEFFKIVINQDKHTKSYIEKELSSYFGVRKVYAKRDEIYTLLKSLKASNKDIELSQAKKENKLKSSEDYESDDEDLYIDENNNGNDLINLKRQNQNQNEITKDKMDNSDDSLSLIDEEDVKNYKIEMSETENKPKLDFLMFDEKDSANIDSDDEGIYSSMTRPLLEIIEGSTVQSSNNSSIDKTCIISCSDKIPNKKLWATDYFNKLRRNTSKFHDKQEIERNVGTNHKEIGRKSGEPFACLLPDSSSDEEDNYSVQSKNSALNYYNKKNLFPKESISLIEESNKNSLRGDPRSIEYIDSMEIIEDSNTNSEDPLSTEFGFGKKTIINNSNRVEHVDEVLSDSESLVIS